ncbi:MAG: hypothetical protein NT099_07215 [Candidatus Saganbacteria bacterium]|nr:hypothetical protein [Candidatus Saganbacteria bacterium]
MKKTSILLLLFVLLSVLLCFPSVAKTATSEESDSVWDKTLWPKDFTPSDFSPNAITTVEGEDEYIDTEPITEEGITTNEVWYKNFNPDDFKPESNITIESE